MELLLLMYMYLVINSVQAHDNPKEAKTVYTYFTKPRSWKTATQICRRTISLLEVNNAYNHPIEKDNSKSFFQSLIGLLATNSYDNNGKECPILDDYQQISKVYTKLDWCYKGTNDWLQVTQCGNNHIFMCETDKKNGCSTHASDLAVFDVKTVNQAPCNNCTELCNTTDGCFLTGAINSTHCTMFLTSDVSDSSKGVKNCRYDNTANLTINQTNVVNDSETQSFEKFESILCEEFMTQQLTITTTEQLLTTTITTTEQLTTTITTTTEQLLTTITTTEQLTTTITTTEQLTTTITPKTSTIVSTVTERISNTVHVDSIEQSSIIQSSVSSVGFRDSGGVLRTHICRDVIVVTEDVPATERAVSSIFSDLIVKKSNISAFYNKKISVVDYRTSSTAIGCIGIILFSVPFALLLASDGVTLLAKAQRLGFINRQIEVTGV